MAKVLEQFRSNYSATQAEEISIEEYLDLCKREPVDLRHRRRAHARRHRRARAGRHAQRPAPVAHLRQPGHQALPRVRASSTAWKTRSSRSSRSSSMPRRASRRRSRSSTCSGPVGGGKSSIAERLKQLMEQRADLRAQGLAGQRVAARPVRTRARRRRCSRRNTASRAATCTGIMSPVGGQAAGGVRRRHLASSASSASSRRCCARSAIAKTEPGDENNQDISSLVGKVDIRKLESLCAGRPRRVQLLRRPVPREPGPARVRRDVQGADQDAAPAADGDAGRQLQGHRRLLARSRSTASSSPTRNESRVEDASATTRTTRRSSTASTSSRCRTACACPRK